MIPRAQLSRPLLVGAATALSVALGACQAWQGDYSVDDYLASEAASEDFEPVDPSAVPAEPSVGFTAGEPQVSPDGAPDAGAEGDALAPGKPVAELLKPESKEVLQGATVVESFRMAGGREAGPGKAGDQQFARRVTTLLLDGKRVADWGAALCDEFDPAVGFRMKSAKGTAELLLSFQCDELRLRVKNAKGELVQEVRADFPEEKGGRSEFVTLSDEVLTVN